MIDGTQGIVNAADGDWTESNAVECSDSGQRLYCFSQVATVVFVDDFESGGPTAWSFSAGG
jgi:hypothetical protein